MSVIMTKGSGSLEALKKTDSPFSIDAGKGEIEGAATINDLRLDAHNSKILLEAGIRTRVALGVYQLQEIQIQGKNYGPDDIYLPELLQSLRIYQVLVFLPQELH